MSAALVRAHEPGAHGQQRDLGAALGPRHVLEAEQTREQIELLRDDVDVDPGLVGGREVGGGVEAVPVGEQRLAMADAQLVD